VKSDWDASNARSLAEEPIVRLILDGTVGAARPQGHRHLAAGRHRRARGRAERPLVIKSMGGESAEA
jgi:hypothetical protein